MMIHVACMMWGWIDTGNTAAVRAFMRYRRDKGGVCKLGTQARVRSFWMLDTRLSYQSEMNYE